MNTCTNRRVFRMMYILVKPFPTRISRKTAHWNCSNVCVCARTQTICISDCAHRSANKDHLPGQTLKPYINSCVLNGCEGVAPILVHIHTRKINRLSHTYCGLTNCYYCFTKLTIFESLPVVIINKFNTHDQNALLIACGAMQCFGLL